jgi:hypothetical protein
MKVVKIVLLTALLVTLSATVSLAGKGDSFQNWADGDKAYKKVWFGPANTAMNSFSKVGFPKRVGLVSFYLFDTGTYKFSAMAATYGGTYSKKWGLNPKGANQFSSEFAKRSVPGLKKQFAEYGMELLTPIEFLKTEEQIDAYHDFSLPEGKLVKATMAVYDFLDKNPHADGAADGYAMIPTHIMLNRATQTAMDELRVALGLDGLVVVTNLTRTTQKDVAFTGASMDIFGPNPDPKPEKFAKFWTPGILYVRGTFGKGFKGIPFAWWAKRSGEKTTRTNPVTGQTTTYSSTPLERAEYDGYEAIIESLAKRTLEELQKFYDKGK